jgi:peroxiredoxin (alkyl hydroperoxide reductase subunit C)
VRECDVESTPTVLIAGQPFAGAKSADFYRYYINEALKSKSIASPVPAVAKPEDGARKAGGSVVPLEMIFPVNEMKPRDSRLAVHVGGYAPDFTLPTVVPGQKVELSDFRGKKNVVLSFVPAAWTPNCSAQWPEYNDAKEEFRQLDAELIGITVDNVPSLYSWTVTMGRPWFTIASDFWPHGKVARTYGVLRSDGVSERALFVIDKKGVIRYIDVHDINTRPSLDVLLKELGKIQ